MLALQRSGTDELWVDLTKLCLQVGRRLSDDQSDIYEIEGVAFEILLPCKVGDLVGTYGSRERMDAMMKNFTTMEPQFGYKYSYGERIFQTGNKGSSYEFLKSLLSRRPDTKTATISLIRADDFEKNHIPCITSMDFKIREGKISLHYFARSQDIYKKSYADNLAMGAILQRLAQDIGCEVGKICGYLASAHVYTKDFPEMAGLPPFAEAVRGRA